MISSHTEKMFYGTLFQRTENEKGEGFAYQGGPVPVWAAQFSFGFYSLMRTLTLIGLIVMLLYRPRTWCTFCPMGTMTQGICKIKNR